MTENVHRNSDRAMTNEQFTEVVGAILEGKYSWACVLILKFSGFNPLHYIPYRTYNRLMKDNCQNKSHRTKELKSSGSQKIVRPIHDLNYLEPIGKNSKDVVGGHLIHFEYNYWVKNSCS